MEKYYRIAGIEVCIRSTDVALYQNDKMLAPFASEKTDGAESFTFHLADFLPRPQGVCIYSSPSLREYVSDGVRERYIGPVEQSEQDAHTYVRYADGDNTVVLSSRSYSCVTPKSVLNAIGMEHLAVKSFSVILHSSYISTELGAILFTAPSGTGKSTQARLWSDTRGAVTVNGDRAIIKPVEGVCLACSLPYSGSSGICKNIDAPIAAIVRLSQGTDNKLTLLKGYRAFSALWEGCVINTWNKEDAAVASEVLQRTVQDVRVYHFECMPDEKAVEVLFNELSERK